MRVLVTGGTGQVGRALIPILNARGDEVVVIARRQLSPVDGAALRLVDINDVPALGALLRQTRFDAIIHLAASNGQQPDEDIKRTNIVGTQALLDVISKTIPPGIPLVLVSSSAVYGAANDNPITEETAPAPVGAYGVSKLSAEAAGRQMFQQTGHTVVIARPFNIIGGGQKTPLLSSVVAAQLVAIERGLIPPVIETGDLGAYRDFIDVHDVARGMAELSRKGRAGEAYNLCTGLAVRSDQLVAEMISLSTARQPVSVTVKKGGAPGVPYQRGSNAKMQRETGWSPEIPLKNSLSDTLAFWRRLSDSEVRSYVSKPSPDRA